MRVLIAGDFCPQFKIAERSDKKDYESVHGKEKIISHIQIIQQCILSAP